MLFDRVLPLLACAVSAVFAAYPNPGPVTGNINPVHDPSVVKGPDGIWRLYSTGRGLDARESKDRTAWTYTGSVFGDTQPPGASTYVDASKRGNDLWAPDVHYDAGSKTYNMYYTASAFGTQNSAIYLATSTTGRPGTFTPKGVVVSSKTGDPYNAIDGAFYQDGSRQWLAFGSFWNGIFIIELDPSTGKAKSGATPINIAKRPLSVSGAVEGPSIIKVGSYFYLMTSWDKCCSGTSSTYNTRVVRSSSITGPYVDQAGVSALNGGGTLVLASHDLTYGPGGGSVVQDGSQIVYYYHHYEQVGSSLGINLLDFSSGWPVAF